jgi:hypothetical protein
VPSWFVSSWSKILRASALCEVLAPVDGVAVEAGGAGGDAVVVDGAVVDVDGLAAVVVALDGGAACASIVLPVADVAVVSEVAAQAAPASIKAAAAVTSWLEKAFIGIPFTEWTTARTCADSASR